MHPARQALSPAGFRNPSTRHRTSPPHFDSPQPIPPSHNPQQSLPSIRQLQLINAPTTGMSQHMSTGSADNTGYVYTTSHYPSSSSSHAVPPDTSLTQLPASTRYDTYGSAGPSSSSGAGAVHARDSDGDDGEQGPPKKKRRRQALSCTGMCSFPAYVLTFHVLNNNARSSVLVSPRRHVRLLLQTSPPPYRCCIVIAYGSW